jgi:hypothetical protein
MKITVVYVYLTQIELIHLLVNVIKAILKIQKELVKNVV